MQKEQRKKTLQAIKEKCKERLLVNITRLFCDADENCGDVRDVRCNPQVAGGSKTRAILAGAVRRKRDAIVINQECTKDVSLPESCLREGMYAKKLNLQNKLWNTCTLSRK